MNVSADTADRARFQWAKFCCCGFRCCCFALFIKQKDHTRITEIPRVHWFKMIKWNLFAVVCACERFIRGLQTHKRASTIEIRASETIQPMIFEQGANFTILATFPGAPLHRWYNRTATLHPIYAMVSAATIPHSSRVDILWATVWKGHHHLKFQMNAGARTLTISAWSDDFIWLILSQSVNYVVRRYYTGVHAPPSALNATHWWNYYLIRSGGHNNNSTANFVAFELSGDIVSARNTAESVFK